MDEELTGFAINFIAIMGVIFLSIFAITLITAFILYEIDRHQTTHTIRRNYPFIGRFRYLFEHIGEFFRQYFFAMDREEMPFNRAQRSWIYRAAKNVDSTIAFGSSRDLRIPGTYYFLNCPFPTLKEEAVKTQPLRIGPHCEHPYDAPSFFNISGMSYGALSRPAVEALAKGAKAAGCWMNTGEGGVSPYHLEAGCDIVYQIGTAKYGLRDEQGHLSEEKLKEKAAYPQIKMFEIKLSQGAKPGKGGILPAEKVSKEVSEIRGIPLGQDSISPNRHPDIATIDDLLDMINRIRSITGKPCGFKMVLGDSVWLDEFFEAVIERGVEQAPDFITIDSSDGGTGAAPMPLMDSVGLPLRESLPIVVNKLMVHELRGRIRVIASGKLITPTDVAAALCMGADFAVTARGFMFALGCIQALQCNKNTCPTGITTHKTDLQRGLVPKVKAHRVESYHVNLVKEVEMIAHSCGVSEPRLFNRRHCAIVVEGGRSVPLNILYPEF